MARFIFQVRIVERRMERDIVVLMFENYEPSSWLGRF